MVGFETDAGRGEALLVPIDFAVVKASGAGRGRGLGLNGRSPGRRFRVTSPGQRGGSLGLVPRGFRRRGAVRAALVGRVGAFRPSALMDGAVDFSALKQRGGRDF